MPPRQDMLKQRWEQGNEFPLVCETCLGDNPYVRMTVEAYGKKCQICEAPFTVTAWQAGTKGRLKRVEICQNCARLKNVCQVCIYDLQYGLPVQVRDSVLSEYGSSAAGKTGNALLDAGDVPQSLPNRAWYTETQKRQLELQGDDPQCTVTNDLATEKLRSMAQMKPAYERNLAKLCTFFARGECNRGDACPFRHELPAHHTELLKKQNTRDRFHGTHDPVAKKMLDKLALDKVDDDNYEKSRATVYIRSEQPLTETTVRDAFYAHGEIVSVHCTTDGSAFCEYAQPAQAELAIASVRTVNQLPVQVRWARATKRGESSSSSPPTGARNNNHYNRNTTTSHKRNHNRNTVSQQPPRRPQQQSSTTSNNNKKTTEEAPAPPPTDSNNNNNNNNKRKMIAAPPGGGTGSKTTTKKFRAAPGLLLRLPNQNQKQQQQQQPASSSSTF